MRRPLWLLLLWVGGAAPPAASRCSARTLAARACPRRPPARGRAAEAGAVRGAARAAGGVARPGGGAAGPGGGGWGLRAGEGGACARKARDKASVYCSGTNVHRLDVSDAACLPWGDGAVDLIVTSPPYGIGVPYADGGDVAPAKYWALAQQWATEMRRVVRP